MILGNERPEILIVEDDALIAANLTARLRKLGYDVRGSAKSGEEAVKLIAERKPDLVLMDVVLQGDMDGIESAEIIKRRWDVPIVFLTAHTDAARMEKAKLIRPFGCLVKPIRDRDLEITINMAMCSAKLDAKNREAEKRLRSETFWRRTLIHGSRDGIVVLDHKGKVHEANRKFRELLGYEPEEVLNLHVWDWDAQWDETRLLQMIDTVEEQGDHFETRHRKKDGTLIDVEISTSAAFQEGEKLILCVCRDITERKRAADALKISEANFRRFFDSMTDIVVVATLEGRILFTNQTMREKLGYSEEELASMNIRDWNRSEDSNETESIFADSLEGDRPLHYLSLRRKDGTAIPVESRFSRGQWGGENCVFVIIKDLTVEQEALQRFERLFRSNPALMALSSMSDHRFVDVNDAFLEKLGYSRADVIGKSSGELGLFPDVQRQKAAVDRLTSEKRITDVELKVRTKEGLLRYGLFSGEQIVSRDRKLFLTVMIDITDRKLAEKTLRESERKLSLAIKVAKMGYWWIDCTTDKVEWSPGHDSLFGIPMEDFGGTLDAVQECVHPEDREHGIKNLQKALEEDVPFDNTYRVVHPNGDIRWLYSYGHVFRDRQGEPDILFGITQDITDRLQAEEAILRSERRNRAILRTAMDGFCRMDLEGRLIEVNDSFCRISGYSEDELVGMSVSDLDVNNNSAEIQTRLAEIVGLGHYRFTSRHRRKDGRIIDVEISAQHYPHEGGVSVAFVRDISQQKKVESQLQSHAALVEQVSDAIIATDLDLNITSWNSAAERIYGWSALEVLGRHVDRLLQTEWFDQKLEDAQRILGETGLWRGRIRQKNRDGRTLVIEASVSWIYDETGTPVGSITANRDITDREQALRSAETSEARYRSIVNALPDLLFRIDSESRFIDVQTSKPEMLLLPAEEIIGKTAGEVLPADIAELNDRKVLATLKSGDMQVYHYSLDIRGRTRECETRMVLCGDNEVLAVVRDVTEAREAERRLQESETRYNAVVNDQMDSICRFNTDGLLTFVNTCCCNYFGYQADDLIGRSFYRLIPLKNRAFVKEKLGALTFEQPIITYEHEVIDADGHIRWMEWTGNAIFNHQGDISVYQAVGRDITERKILEQKLMKASEREQINLARELHDGLCQDLKGLEIQAALLEHIVRKDNTAAKDLVYDLSSGINSAVRRAYDITQGMFPIDLTPGSFREMLKALAQKAAHQTTTQFSIAIEDNLSLQTQAQAHQLYRIAQEAINNALRHSKATRIDLKLCKKNGEMLLSIRDNGVGIDNKKVETRRGLGMHVMSSRAQAINARLIVQTHESGGTEVLVRLTDE